MGLEVHGDKWLARGTKQPLETRREGGSIFAELGLAALGRIRFECRIGVSIDSYTLPDVMSDTSHDTSMSASAFTQLLATVSR